MASVKTRPPLVVGRKNFVELWALLGFASVVCELPEELPGRLQKVEAHMPPLILAEKGWFEGLHDSLKRRLSASLSPLWLTLPEQSFAETEADR